VRGIGARTADVRGSYGSYCPGPLSLCGISLDTCGKAQMFSKNTSIYVTARTTLYVPT